MKKSLEDTILDNVYLFEKKRTTKYLIMYIVGIFASLLLLIISLIITWSVLEEQKTLDVLDIFTESKEIISEYWKDTLDVFLTELPKMQVSIILLSVLLLGCILFLFIINRKKIVKRLSKLSIYFKRRKNI